MTVSGVNDVMGWIRLGGSKGPGVVSFVSIVIGDHFGFHFSQHGMVPIIRSKVYISDESPLGDRNLEQKEGNVSRTLRGDPRVTLLRSS